MTTPQIIAQVIGFLGTIMVIFGMQQKQYKHIVMCKIGNEFTSSIHYLLLGGWTGMCINLASCFTNGFYYFRIKNGKSTLPFQILFSIMFVTIGALSWHGYIGIFVVIVALLVEMAMGLV